MRYLGKISVVMAVWAAIVPAWAGHLATGPGGADRLGARTLHRAIASPENGYVSPRAQFNEAGSYVTNPIGGYAANGFMAPYGQAMSSPQGGMGSSPSSGGMGAP